MRFPAGMGSFLPVASGGQVRFPVCNRLKPPWIAIESMPFPQGITTFFLAQLLHVNPNCLKNCHFTAAFCKNDYICSPKIETTH